MNGSNDGPSIFDSIFGKGKPIKWYHYLIHLGYYILSSTYKCNFLGADNKQ